VFGTDACGHGQAFGAEETRETEYQEAKKSYKEQQQTAAAQLPCKAQHEAEEER
jgi:hypothetical protein